MKSIIFYLSCIVISSLSLNAQKINLPIEILGEEGKIVEDRFTIDEAQFNRIANTDNLYIQINNLGYEDKGSIRINDGNWIKLNHTTANILSPEKERGGMTHGGYNTIRFTMTIPKTGTGSFRNTSSTGSTQNIIRFRFDTSNGISNGYRVIDLDLLDAAGERILKDSAYYINNDENHTQEFGVSYYIEDDPNTWNSPYYANGSEPNDLNIKIAEGKDLWYYGRNGSATQEGEALWNHYLPNDREGFWYGHTLPSRAPIRAKCASCHTQDGRDLELFSYSNLSIIERSKFHDLTEDEGKKIAAYIRSLSGSSTTSGDIGRYGRPWNPPYQPGPELSNKPVQEWSAGAGLDAVLEKDADMLPYLFPNGTSQQEVNSVYDSDQAPPTHTLPLAIQLPDWKHWLPLIHPKDAFTVGTFYEDTYNDPRSPDDRRDYAANPDKGYERYRAALLAAPKKADGVTVDLGSMNLEQIQELRGYHRYMEYDFQSFLGDNGLRTRPAGLAEGFSQNLPIDLVSTSLARLKAVKNFELVNEFNMQDQDPDYINPVDKPSDRQWFISIGQRHVFEVPAHFTGCSDDDCNSYTGQSTATGTYETSSWYQLQMIITPGYGTNRVNGPVDFNYQPQFIQRASRSSGINEPLRYYHTLNNMYQVKTGSRATNPNDGLGFRIRVMGPFIFLGKKPEGLRNLFAGYDPGEWPSLLDGIESGLTVKILNAQFEQFLTEVEDSAYENTDENLYNEGINRIYNLDGSPNWIRTSESSTNGEKSQGLDPIEKTTILRVVGSIPSGGIDGTLYSDHIFWSIEMAEELGVDCDILKRVVAWANVAWPNINKRMANGVSGPEEDISWDTILSCTSTTLSNNDVKKEKEAFIFPNPVSDMIRLTGLKTGVYQVSIYNLLGQKLLNYLVSDTTSNFNLSGLNSGNYIMIVKNDSYNKVFKIVKN